MAGPPPWLALLSAFALLAAAPAAQDTSFRQPLAKRRLMPVGDSITQGGDGFASWRYPLWFALPAELGLEFVGRRSWVFPTNTESNPNAKLYPDYHGAFDRDHEAWWGARTDQIAGLIYRASEAQRPDVVLVHLGTNDIGQLGEAGLENVRTHLSRLVAEVRAVRPSASFFLAQVIPIGQGNTFFEHGSLVSALNEEIVAVAQTSWTAASPVVPVDQFTGFDLATEMQSGGLHPNELGEQRIAKVWRAALAAHLPFALPPRHVAAAVLDPSFEALALADLVVVERPSGQPWASGGTPNTFRGVYNPGSDTYHGAAGSGTPVGADGDEVAYLYDAGAGSEATALYQTLATTCELGKTYTLRVAVGNRLPGNPYGPSTWGGFRIELLAGNEVIASVKDSLVPPPGEFRDASVAVTMNPLPVRLRRQALTVRMKLTNGAPGSATDFDRVRLEVR